MRPLMRRHRRTLVLSLLGAVVGMVATVFGPLVLRGLVDDVTAGRPLRAGAVVTLLGLGVVRFGAALVRRLYAGRVSYDVEYDLRNAVYQHLAGLDFAAHDRLETGQAMSRAGSDVRMVQMLLAFLPLMIGNLVMLVLSLVVMLILSPALTAIALVVLPALAVASGRMRDRVFPATWVAQQRAADVAGVVDEAVSGVRVVKAFAAEEREVARLEAAARALYGAQLRNVRIQARLVPLIQVLPSFGMAALLLAGGRLVIDGHISLGTFLAFNSYLLQLAAPARMLSGLLSAGQMARAGAVRILELLDTRSAVVEPADAEPVGGVRGEIAFEDVSFDYGDGSAPLLDGFTLRIRAGERVALVGASGSGKSTVASLLPRFYDVDAGRVTLDGTDVRRLRLAELRRSVGIVFEDAFLFSASIADNIAFGAPGASLDQIRAAARAAEADGFIEALPDGYDTMVGERGLTLSGGQRQRVTLARALVTDPKILVLDDATSAVDPTVEAGIHATLRRLMADRTTIVIAHRRSTISLADRIVVVDGGRVLADGTHDELMDRCPRYVELLTGAAPDAEPGLAPLSVVAADTGQTADGPAGNAPATAEAAQAALAGRRGVVAAGRAASWIGRPGGTGAAAATHGGHFALAGAVPADKKLLAQVAALPPADDEPGVDPVTAARPDPHFSLGRFVRPFRGALAVGVGLVAVDALAGLAGPGLVRAGVAGGVARHSTAGLTAATIAFAVVVLVDWWVLWAGARWTGRLSERLLYSLRLKVFAHLSRLGLDFYEREMGGRILTRMTSDIEALSQLFQQGIVNLVASGLTAGGVAVVLFVLDWRLALAALAVVPPLLVLTVWFRRSSDRAYLRIRDKIALVMSSLQESLSGARVVAAFAREERNFERFRALSDEHLDARLEGNRLSATYFPTVELLGQVATTVVVAYGAALIRGGSLTPADLIAFILYLNLFFAPVQQLSQVFDTYQQARAAAVKLADLLATPVSTPEAPDAIAPVDLAGTLGLEGVRFRYGSDTDSSGATPGPPGWALDGVDLTIRAGETVALVGRTGAGKSTIVKLLARFYDPGAGRVTADGTDLRRLSLPAYRRRLGLVPQEAHLFSGTVRDNIAYGRPDATEAEIAEAARAVGADEFIAGLPAGYDTLILERGRSLSSGQRQLLALARARLVDPAVLLLDEATSNLDLRSEARVAAAMGALSQGRTTIIVAHRLATAARADRIVVLGGGRVIEEGSHAALLARHGVYAAMWSAGDPETEEAASEAELPTSEAS
ncbi:MAG: ATP-binding cassette, subfamily bacterial [Actinomycetota bacterium]|nr:ATP-binding cassette, subfamily bacterial [Actinomycetota bacterium]